LSDIILKIQNLSAGYGREAIVSNLSLDIPARSIVTLVGSNGAGKSTLLKAIYGLNTHIGGEIFMNGEPIHQLAPPQRFAKGLGFVPQGRCNFSLMTVQENLDLGGFTLDAERRAAAIEEVLNIFPVLRKRQRVLAGNLSGGEQQLMEMAMVLMISPKILLLDEPSIGLSPINLSIVLENIEAIRERGVTVIMVEQNVKGALGISDHAVVMELGRIVAQGPASEIWNNDAVATAYLGRRVA
jgi:branched-chain amino acid transport system ATP-binding protein